MNNEVQEKVEITESNLKEYADRLQFDTLAQECVVEDIAEYYNISTEDVFVLIHELKKRGNNIIVLNTIANDLKSLDSEEKKSVNLIKNFGHEKLIDDLTYTIYDSEEETKIMLISDTRFGSKNQQLTILNDMYKKAKEMGVKYVFLTGDVVEGVYTGVKSIYNTDLYKYGYDDQSDLVAACFPRVEGITTYFITGERDLSFLKSDKVDIGYLISAKRDDMIYLGPRRKKVTFKDPNKNNSGISIYLQHASGNVPYTISYKPQQMISSMRSEEKADILVTGHFAACDSFLRRGVRSYQVPTVVATTPQMKDANTPVYNTIGTWLVTLKKDKKGNLANTSQMFIPYYKTIIDDYKTAKILYITDNKTIFMNPTKLVKDGIDRKYQEVKNGATVEEVCEKLGISPLKLGGLIEEFKTRGYDIDIKEWEDGNIIIKKRRKNNTQSIKPDISELTKISQVWLSDTHLCNEAQQLHLINQIYKEGAERGVDEYLMFGDLVDGDYTDLRKEQKYALFRLGASRQIEYVTDYYPKVEGKTTSFIVATHDQTHEKNGGVFIGPEIDRRREDMNFLGATDAIYNPLKSKKTKIELYHPGGGCAASLSYKTQKYIDKMEPGNKPNALGVGHYHQSHMMFYRNIFALLVPCLTAKNDFAVRQGLENTMGAYFIDMYVNKDGEIEMFEFEEKRFTAKDCKKDDYLKTKQLVLKTEG